MKGHLTGQLFYYLLLFKVMEELPKYTARVLLKREQTHCK